MSITAEVLIEQDILELIDKISHAYGYTVPHQFMIDMVENNAELLRELSAHGVDSVTRSLVNDYISQELVGEAWWSYGAARANPEGWDQFLNRFVSGAKHHGFEIDQFFCDKFKSIITASTTPKLSDNIAQWLTREWLTGNQWIDATVLDSNYVEQCKRELGLAKTIEYLHTIGVAPEQASHLLR